MRLGVFIPRKMTHTIITGSDPAACTRVAEDIAGRFDHVLRITSLYAASLVKQGMGDIMGGRKLIIIDPAKYEHITYIGGGVHHTPIVFVATGPVGRYARDRFTIVNVEPCTASV
jgi:hypothetical protein